MAHDVVLIGGGPAGSAVATLVAEAGFDVLLLERESFPRFHVGESLIPGANTALERLGLSGDMDQRRFPRKHGVQFFRPEGPTKPFYFDEVRDDRFHQTWQILRSDFDNLMLQRAQRAGVTIDMPCEAVDVVMDGDAVVGVTAREDGSDHIESIDAKVVVDAGGYRGLLARSMGVREVIPDLRNTAVFSHFEGVKLGDGRDAGSTLIFRIAQDAWLWFIPLPDAVSIGLVTRADELSRFGDNPQAILDAGIAQAPHLQERLVEARQVAPAKAARDFSYFATKDGGLGWGLVGDALGFIDPMYSTGLFLALHSAELAADKIITDLRAGQRPDLTDYAPSWHEAFNRFLPLVRAFYTEDFKFGEFASEPSRRQGLVDLLSGVVDTEEAAGVADDLARMLQAPVASSATKSA